MKIRTAALVLIVVLGFVNTVQAKDPPLLSLNMEHFRDTATVKIDPSDDVATITTENGYVESFDRPGLGIDVDEDRVRRHRVQIAVRNVA